MPLTPVIPESSVNNNNENTAVNQTQLYPTLPLLNQFRNSQMAPMLAPTTAPEINLAARLVPGCC